MATMRDKKSARRKSGTLRIPGMKDVEGKIKLPEGEYVVEVSEVTEEEGNAAPYFKWKFKVCEGDCTGGMLFYNTSLATQALWNLRSLMEALGVDVPDDDEEIDIEEFIGKTLMVTVEHDTYEGKKQSKIVDFWPDKKEDKKGGKSKKPARDAEEDEAEEDDAPRKPTRAEKRRAAKASKKDDDGEDGESDDGDEAEADEPKSRGSRSSRGGSADKKVAKKKVSLTQDEVQDMGEDELVDLVAEHELDVDLDDLSTLRKKKAAVIDALEEAGVIESE